MDEAKCHQTKPESERLLHALHGRPTRLSCQRFFDEMDEAGVDWIFHHHAGTPHGFALPPTLGPPGALHETSDRRSTMGMLALLREVFPGVPQAQVEFNAAGTRIPA